MKNKIVSVIAYLTIVCSSFLVSCERSIDLEPDSNYTFDNFWNSKEESEAAVLGIYCQMQVALKANYAYWGDARGGLLIRDNSSDEAERLTTNMLNSGMGSSSWDAIYVWIGYANHCMKNIPLVKDKTFTDNNRLALLSEVYWARALAYFYIARIWQSAPLVTEPTTSTDENMFVKQVPSEQIFNQIFSDLDNARVGIVKDYGTDNRKNRGRATLSAVYALRTDVLMWLHEYEEAVVYADSLKNAMGNISYDYVAPADWGKVFKSATNEPGSGNSKEAIFELQFSQLEFSTSNFSGRWNGYCDFRPNAKCLELFSARQGEGDVRAAQTIKDVNSETTEIWKYTGKNFPSGGIYDNNLIIYRWSDIQLLKAEALNRLGKRIEAIEIVETLRTKRYGRIAPLTNINKNSMDEVELAILEERAMEFMAEGKRWFDVVRTGRVDELINPTLVTRIIDQNNYFWPISTSAMRVNPNLTQNPYYQSTGE